MKGCQGLLVHAPLLFGVGLVSVNRYSAVRDQSLAGLNEQMVSYSSVLFGILLNWIPVS